MKVSHTNNYQMNYPSSDSSSNNVYYHYPQTTPVYSYHSPVMAPLQPVQMVTVGMDLENLMLSVPLPNISAINTSWQPMVPYQMYPAHYTPVIYDPNTGVGYPYTTPGFNGVSKSLECSPNFVPVEAPEIPEVDFIETKEGEVPAGPEENAQGTVQNKYPFRSKQKKIDKVRGMIKDHFEERGLFAAEKELVRGDDTVRVHVKTFPGLTKIQEALKEIEDHPSLQITRIACPFSKKNKKQKKGFIVYLKVASVPQRELVQEIFAKYEDVLKNCVTARPKPRAPTEGQSKFDDYTLNLAPPAMEKSASGG